MKMSAWLVIAIACTMTGCGLSPNVAIAPAKLTLQKATDASDHAQMNALVKKVLDGQFKTLLTDADANHDGTIAQAEYAQDHDLELTKLFMAQFDANQDLRVSAAEYESALKGTAAIEAYHHLTEARMEKAIASIAGSKGFGFMEMRSYLTKELGLSGDFPFISKLMNRVDLDQDGKAFSDSKEGAAFMIFFAQAQLEHVLGLPVSPLNF